MRTRPSSPPVRREWTAKIEQDAWAHCALSVKQPPPKQTTSNPQYESLWDAEEPPDGCPAFRNSPEVATVLQISSPQISLQSTLKQVSLHRQTTLHHLFTAPPGFAPPLGWSASAEEIRQAVRKVHWVSGDLLEGTTAKTSLTGDAACGAIECASAGVCPGGCLRCVRRSSWKPQRAFDQLAATELDILRWRT